MSNLSEGFRIAGVAFSFVLLTLVTLSILLWAIGVVLRRFFAGGEAGKGKDKAGKVATSSDKGAGNG